MSLVIFPSSPFSDMTVTFFRGQPQQKPCVGSFVESTQATFVEKIFLLPLPFILCCRIKTKSSTNKRDESDLCAVCFINLTLI